MRIPRQPAHLGRLRPDSLTARQSEVLDQLEVLYLENGFSRQTLDALANELRCSKMTLYTLAPSREQLAVAVLRRYFERAGGAIEREILLVGEPDRKIEVYIRTLDHSLRAMSEVCFHEVIGFEPTREAYEAFARRQTAGLARLLDDGVTGEEHVPGAFTAEMVRVTLESMCAREFEIDASVDIDSALDHLVVVALATRPPARRTRGQATRRKR